MAVGAALGLLIGSAMTPALNEAVMNGLGLVTVGIGIKMLLQTKNFLIVAAAIALGGIIGTVLGVQNGIVAFGDWAKANFGGDSGTFSEAIVVTSILFCVGPMTLLGCLEDALEHKIDILALKSTMDGFAAMFFAAALGAGVLVTAFVVLTFQSALTLAAHPLRQVAQDPDMIVEVGATGGAMLLGTGLGLLGIKSMSVANYLPALAIAPLLVISYRAMMRKSHLEAPE